MVIDADDSPFPPGGLARIREHLRGALHLGRLAPGDRIPSVRRMAMLTGLDRKTVHRAYARLVAERMLVTRPGSGTFFATEADGPTPERLVAAAVRMRGEADAMGLDPETYARFLGRMAGGALAHVPLAVVECNHEQLGLISRELRATLGVIVRPVVLDELAPSIRSVAAGVRAVVTTECHRDDVQRAAGPFGLPVHRVALDPGHAENLLRHARRGALVMAVRDLRYEPAFRRLLAQLAVPPEVGARIRVVEPRQLGRALREVEVPAALYTSPLLDPGPLPPLPPGWRRVAPHPYLDAGALDLLRAQLALLEARAPAAPPAAARPVALSS